MVNTTHVSNKSLLQELKEFTDKEDWIDELENNNEKMTCFNPWSDDNSASYLANSCEKDKILFNVNKELEKEQFRQAESLLNKNTYIFIQKISKEGQMVEL
ncbi:29538_t:CDS:2 [Gigaspora margarita]|uniref:29538_t:CDS:1 n=1 Tax=Gigaspora margarita TaxID=4874 RepID=A0ABN7V8P0_GIGMA|nr:29538_t:CDS:2 [Gigaspora margarita]